MRPVDLVSACSTTTIDGLGFPTAFGLRYYGAELVAAHRTGSGKVYSHPSSLTLQILSDKSNPLPNIKAEIIPGIMIELFRLLRNSRN